MPLMSLIRLLDNEEKEWLIVQDSDGREVLKLEWNDDLMIWLDTHEEQIEKGDINTFLEYRRQRRFS
jgi:hypothetical protein